MDQRFSRILITAGPTHEPLDDVRYVANRSSGRLGLALARATQERGVPTTLLLGPGPATPPDGTLLSVERFHTAADLARLLAQHWPQHELLLMAAAVADFRPRDRTEGKLDRRNGPLRLELEPVPDLLAGLAASSRPDQIRIGWALAPTDTLEATARRKLEEKDLDAIVANPLETMGAQTISATVYWRGGEVLKAPPDVDKRVFAEWLVRAILGAGDG